MLKNFATSSRLVRDTRNSHDTRTNVVRKSRDKIRKTVARNSHASEILALKTLLREGLSDPEFYGDLVYKFNKLIGRNDFSFQFRKNH